MKILFRITFILTLLIFKEGRSQSSQNPVAQVTIQIKNELTRLPLDAVLSGLEEGKIKRKSTGEYLVFLDPGKSEVLTISRDGYFDYNLKIDYEAVKSSQFLEVELKPGVPQLVITILDDETAQTLTAMVDLFTMDESSIVFSEGVEISPYTIDLEYDKVHVLQVRCPGYFSYKDTINLARVFDGREMKRNIRLVPLKVGNKISLNNIYFQPNVADLTGFAKVMLVELTHILQLEKNIVIEIGAHTDGVGSNEYNQSLSEKRAISVKRYLIEKGAADRQLLVKGYGESFPVASNDTEETRSLNRRVEFKIVSIK
jgi:outer membrane protein OmpA-like peptidoglycan-associated protein